MFCYRCGEEIISGAKFCTKCGTKVIDTEAGYRNLQSDRRGRRCKNQADFSFGRGSRLLYGVFWWKKSLLW